MLTLYKYIEPEETPTDTPTETPIPESTIPSVLGQSRSDAENTLRSAGFSNIQINPSTQSTNNQYQDGTVYYQTPSSGTQSPTTTTVTLTLYKYIEPEETPEETETPIPAQTAQIPNVSGKSYGDAVKDLKAKGFTTFKQEPKDTNNNADVGKVISTSPTAGNQYDITKPVTIYVGSTPLEPTSSDDATD
jgi:serine/threonine-protein kinase